MFFKKANDRVEVVDTQVESVEVMKNSGSDQVFPSEVKVQEYQREDAIDLKDKFFFSGDKSNDLLMLFSRSIDLWTEYYHMENVPKRMIFQQALSALNVLNNMYKEKKS